MDTEITKRLYESLGDMQNIIQIGTDGDNTIFVYVDKEFSGNLPSTFEGHSVEVKKIDKVVAT
jgi:hypothetical protein